MTSHAQDIDPRDLPLLSLSVAAAVNERLSAERELVNQAIAAGLIAERAYASNGRALGHAESVDLTVSGCRVQAKRRKRIADYLQPTADHDAVAFRQDRGETLVLLRWTDFLQLIDRAGGW